MSTLEIIAFLNCATSVHARPALMDSNDKVLPLVCSKAMLFWRDWQIVILVSGCFIRIYAIIRTEFRTLLGHERLSP